MKNTKNNNKPALRTNIQTEAQKKEYQLRSVFKCGSEYISFFDTLDILHGIMSEVVDGAVETPTSREAKEFLAIMKPLEKLEEILIESRLQPCYAPDQQIEVLSAFGKRRREKTDQQRHFNEPRRNGECPLRYVVARNREHGWEFFAGSELGDKDLRIESTPTIKKAMGYTNRRLAEAVCDFMPGDGWEVFDRWDVMSKDERFLWLLACPEGRKLA